MNESPQNTLRVGIYCRVSTDLQNIENQLHPLVEYATRRNFVLEGLYSDVGVSGTKTLRPGLNALMEAARARRIDLVLVQRFDRFARSVSHLIRSLEEFNAIGVEFISLSESVDTSTPMGKMVFTVMAAVAELERNIIVERIQAGLNRARKQGKSIGRPRRIFDREKALSLHRTGVGLRGIAKRLGVSRETIRKVIHGKDQ